MADDTVADDTPTPSYVDVIALVDQLQDGLGQLRQTLRLLYDDPEEECDHASD